MLKEYLIRYSVNRGFTTGIAVVVAESRQAAEALLTSQGKYNGSIYDYNILTTTLINDTDKYHAPALLEEIATGPGFSAYEIARQHGYTGTEQEWLESIKGAKGEQGPVGPAGKKGDKGDKGDPGPTGAQGIQGVQGIQGPNGKRGIQGPKGPEGPQGKEGASAYQIWKDQGNSGSKADFLRSLKGEKGDKGDKGDMVDVTSIPDGSIPSSKLAQNAASELLKTLPTYSPTLMSSMRMAIQDVSDTREGKPWYTVSLDKIANEFWSTLTDNRYYRKDITEEASFLSLTLDGSSTGINFTDADNIHLNGLIHMLGGPNSLIADVTGRGDFYHPGIIISGHSVTLLKNGGKAFISDGEGIAEILDEFNFSKNSYVQEHLSDAMVDLLESDYVDDYMSSRVDEQIVYNIEDGIVMPGYISEDPCIDSMYLVLSPYIDDATYGEGLYANYELTVSAGDGIMTVPGEIVSRNDFVSKTFFNSKFPEFPLLAWSPYNVNISDPSGYTYKKAKDISVTSKSKISCKGVVVPAVNTTGFDVHDMGDQDVDSMLLELANISGFSYRENYTFDPKYALKVEDIKNLFPGVVDNVNGTDRVDYIQLVSMLIMAVSYLYKKL